MNDPTTATWHVVEDGLGDLTLWHGDTAVLRKWLDLDSPDEYQDLLWSVLTRVLAPDEATIERLEDYLDRHFEAFTPHEYVENVVAALAGTAAQDAEVSS